MCSKPPIYSCVGLVVVHESFSWRMLFSHMVAGFFFTQKVNFIKISLNCTIFISRVLIFAVFTGMLHDWGKYEVQEEHLRMNTALSYRKRVESPTPFAVTAQLYQIVARLGDIIWD